MTAWAWRSGLLRLGLRTSIRATMGIAMLLPVLSCRAQPPVAPFVLGVQTHFNQNWPTGLVDTAIASKAGSLRDAVSWTRAEPSKGRYTFDGPTGTPLIAFCKHGGDLLLTLVPRNPLYDGGATVSSPEGIEAASRYAAAMADRYAACLAGIEVGNEINDKRNLPYPAGVDPAAAYVALVSAIAKAVHAKHPRVAILGGSTNVIATGFLNSLFARGLLDVADGIAVHPYRSHAENIGFELAHLRAVMRRRGRVLPIWATEFSDNFATAGLAASELVKMVALMSDAGVARAYWYALMDQTWFNNMGLYDAQRHAKPAADAFRIAQTYLVGPGRIARIDTGTSPVAMFQTASGGYVLWGSGGSIAFDGPAIVRNAVGHILPRQGVYRITAEPILVEGATAYRLDSSPVLADSLFGYGGPDWSYFAQSGNATPVGLSLIDGNWTSQFGANGLRPLWLEGYSASPIGGSTNAKRVIIRYTAPKAEDAMISACLAKQVRGDGVDISVLHNGKVLQHGVMTDTLEIRSIPVKLAAGDRIDFSVGPNMQAGGDGFRYRLRMLKAGAAMPTPCPQHPATVAAAKGG